MCGRKWAALLAAVWAAAYLQGCGGKISESGQLKVLPELLRAGNNWREALTAHFDTYPEEYQDLIQADGIFLQTNGGVYGQQYMEDFLRTVQEGNPAEVEMMASTVEGDHIFYYVAYDGETYYYFCDFSRDAFGGDVDRYIRGEYAYLRTFPLDGYMVRGTEYALTNDPDGVQGMLMYLEDYQTIYTDTEEKSPDEVKEPYESKMNLVKTCLRDSGFYWESDSEKGEILNIVDGKAENPEVWDAFYEQVLNNKTSQLNIHENFSDGRSLQKWVHYAGDDYWMEYRQPIEYYVCYKNDSSYILLHDHKEYEYPGAYVYNSWENVEACKGEQFYFFEQDGRLQVGIGADRTGWDEKYQLSEKDFEVSIMPIVEFDR